ncbi:CRAL-TRIO domain-containing protein [Hyaloraphidium curvatum]|nr:CRAL-TRIO domain-containing protein [Hyaloraphidium curvatum]
MEPTRPEDTTVIDWTVGAHAERPLEEQLASLSPTERAAFDELKAWYNERPRPVEFDDAMFLRLLRNSPGATKFNVAAAQKVAEHLAPWSHKIHLEHLTIRDVRKQLETNCLIYTGGVNSAGHRNLYMRPARFRPGKDSLDDLLRSLVYLLQVMSEEERTQTYGLSFTADMTDWGWSNFGVNYASSFFSTVQGRYPCRIREFIIYNPPSWFNAIWKIIRPMMSKEFADKVAFVPSSGAASLYPSMEHVPKCMGGQLDEIKANADFVRYRYKVEGLDYSAPYGEPAKKAEMMAHKTS